MMPDQCLSQATMRRDGLGRSLWIWLWLSLGLLISCEQSGQDAELPRPDKSLIPGRIAFVGTEVGSGFSALCVLDLSSGTVTPYRNKEHIYPSSQTTPRWDIQGRRICFEALVTRAGLFEFDTQDGNLRIVLPQGEILHGGISNRLIYYEDSSDGMLIGVSPPGVNVSVDEFDYGNRTGSLYVLLNYEIQPGTPEWQFSVDSIDVPNWMKSRVGAMSSEGHKRWTDLIKVLSTDSVVVLRSQEWPFQWGLAVSPDERYVAFVQSPDYVSAHELHLWDLTNDELLFPKLPAQFRPGDIEFAPDGSTLAVEGSMGGDPGAIHLIGVPEYASAEAIESTRRKGIFQFCWSPRGDWLMLEVGVRGACDLVAIETRSGRQVEIEQPFLVNESKGTRYYVSDGLDWTN